MNASVNRSAGGNAALRLRGVDLLAGGICLLFASINLVFTGTHEVELAGLSFDRNASVAALWFACLPAILLLVRTYARRSGEPLGFIRTFYVQAMYALFFPEVIYLSQRIAGGASFDAMYYRMDEAIFGFQPAVELPAMFGHLRWLNEIFYFAYFFFYLLITVGQWRLYLRGRDNRVLIARAERGLFIITASFAILYVWYLVYPVHGPKYYIESLRQVWYSDLDGYLFTWLMRLLFDNSNLAGAALPSSHVAVSLIAIELNRRWNRSMLPVLAPLTLLLIISTVYLYAHYVVDVFFGIAVAFVLFPVSAALYAPVERLAGRIPTGWVAAPMRLPKRRRCVPTELEPEP